MTIHCLERVHYERTVHEEDENSKQHRTCIHFTKLVRDRNFVVPYRVCLVSMLAFLVRPRQVDPSRPFVLWTMVVNCVDMSKGKGKAKSKPMPKPKSKISVLTETEINTRSRSRSRARARPTQGQNKDKGRGKDKGKDKDKDKVCLLRLHQDCDGSGPFCHLEFVGSEACRTRSHNHRRVLEFLASDSD